MNARTPGVLRTILVVLFAWFILFPSSCNNIADKLRLYNVHLLTKHLHDIQEANK